MSFTEKEYEYALSKKIPVLAFLHKNLEKIRKSRIVDFWSDYGDLCTKVVIAAGQSVNLAPGVGWVRGDQAIDPKVLQDFERLRRENEELKQRLSELTRIMHE